MAQAQRRNTSQSSSTAGDSYDEHFSDDDICGSGCFADGVPANAATVGCEHGTFAVRETTKRKAPPAPRAPETVHDRSIHHESEQSIAPDSGAVGQLLELFNSLSGRVQDLEGKMRLLLAAIEAPAQAEQDPAEESGE